MIPADPHVIIHEFLIMLENRVFATELSFFTYANIIAIRNTVFSTQ